MTDGREFAGTARFDVVRRIGGGGMGLVYEAVDHETNRRVAVKTLRSMSAEALLLFKNEFRSLTDIEHPNLVTLGELFEAAGEWFFSMELVSGVHLLTYVQAPVGRDAPTIAAPIGDDSSTPDAAHGHRRMAPEASPPSARPRTGGDEKARAGTDIPKLRAVLGQLARGLNALHDANKVHRDIKPSNILVTSDGRVVILDFGLVTEAAAHDATDDRLVGTVAYMAPEQAAAQRVGPEADWYAVGVMLYQALTGHLPVRGSAAEVAMIKRLVEPAPPSYLADGIPADLDRLCTRLLRIDPKERPTGRDVLRALGIDDHDTPGPTASTRFVGRDVEMAVLREAFAAARGGDAVTVLVSGESGVGKSAFVRRFGDAAAASDGALVLRSRCHERESVPYKAINGVVDALSRHLAALPEADLRAYAPEHAELLTHVFPVLRELWPLQAMPGADGGADPHLQRARLFASMRELFARVAARRPLVLCIDDLQWADTDGLALLEAVLRPPSAPALLLVGTLRAALATESGARAVQLVAAAIPGDVRRIELAALPNADALTLATELLGPNSTRERAQAIASEAAGHPLFIDELVRRRGAGGADAAPLRLEDALWARIVRLETPARSLLTLLVVAGAPIALEAAARAADLQFGDFSTHAALLRAGNFARTSGLRKGDSIEPYHDRLRSTVIAHLSSAEKKACHGQLARALEAASSVDPEALAVHFREAGDVGKAASYAVRAADAAAEALAFDRAARLYAMSLELAPGQSDEATLRTNLGLALANAGRGAEAADAFLAAVPLVDDPAAALDLRRRAAEQLLYCGHIDAALATFGEVLEAVDVFAPKTPKASLALLLARRAHLRLRGLDFTQKDEAELSPELLTRIDACWAVGIGLGLVDTIRGSYFQVRTLLLALDAGEPRRIARSLAGEVCFSSAEGGRSRARTARLLAQADGLSHRIGDPYAIAWARGAAGISASLEGRWAEAVPACDEAEVLFGRCIGAAWEIGQMRWFGLWAIAYLGRLRDLTTRVTRGLREAKERGDLYGIVRHSTGLHTWRWLAEDDPRAARAHCREALARWSQRTFHVEHWWAMLAERQIDLYEGRAAEGYRVVGETWPRLSSSLLLMVQLTSLEALHLRARTAIAAAADGRDAKALLAVAANDARKIRRAAMPWSTPLADLLDAAIAARRGEATRARELCGAAATGLDAAGMALYAAAARHRAGELEGGDAGRALREGAEQWMRSEGIAAPNRFVTMLAPGFGAD